MSESSPVGSTGESTVDSEDPNLEENRAAKRHSARYLHDGFYFRLGLGMGSLSGSLSDESGGSMDLSGTPLQIDFSVGGVASRGFVVGGGIFASISNAPGYVETANGQSAKLDGGALATAVVGPFFDWYFNPKNGFHLQAALGPAFVSASKGDPQTVCVAGYCGQSGIKAYSGTGVGMLAGLGYEAWVGPQASLGGLLRLMYVTSGVTPDGSSASNVTLSEFVPGVLLTMTVN